MPRIRFQPEEIIGKLHHTDGLLGQGKRMAQVELTGEEAERVDKADRPYGQ